VSNLPTSKLGGIQQIIEAAERELQQIDHTPFSSNAFTRLKEKVSEYAIQLITESIKTAKRHQADNVSTANVEQASHYLVSTTSRKFYRHLGTIGGILLGTAVSNVVSMVTTNQYNLNGVIITVVFTLVGAAMVAAHIVKD